MDILERVCNGDLSLSQRPFQKTKFNPYGAVQRFKFDDSLFARDTTLFTSTIEAVISLQPDEFEQYPGLYNFDWLKLSLFSSCTDSAINQMV